MKLLQLPLSEIKDLPTREAIKKIQDFINEEEMLQFGFRKLQFTFTKDASGLKIPHKLKFVPRDIFFTHFEGTGNVTINYGKFDATNMDFDITGVDPSRPMKLRLLVGAYPEPV